MVVTFIYSQCAQVLLCPVLLFLRALDVSNPDFQTSNTSPPAAFIYSIHRRFDSTLPEYDCRSMLLSFESNFCASSVSSSAVCVLSARIQTDQNSFGPGQVLRIA